MKPKPEFGAWYWVQIDGEPVIAQWGGGDWWFCGTSHMVRMPPAVEALCPVEPPRGKDGCEACLAGDCSVHAGGDWGIPE